MRAAAVLLRVAAERHLRLQPGQLQRHLFRNGKLVALKCKWETLKGWSLELHSPQDFRYWTFI